MHKRLGTVMACTHSYALLVEQHAYVIRMGIAYEKRYYGILARSITEYTHSGYLFCHTSGSVLQKFALMNLYIAVSDRGNIIDSAMECGYIDKVGGAGFKFEWKFCKSGMLKTDMANHLTTTLIGRHLLKKITAPVKYTHTGRPIHLMGGEYIKVTSDGLNVDRAMTYGLRTVNKHRYSVTVGFPYKLLYRINRPKHIAHMSHCHKRGLFVKQLAISVKVKHSAVIHRDYAECHPRPISCHGTISA